LHNNQCYTQQESELLELLEYTALLHSLLGKDLHNKTTKLEAPKLLDYKLDHNQIDNNMVLALTVHKE